MKSKNKGIRRIVEATSNSVKGIKYVWNNEEAFRIELVIVCVLSFLAYLIPVNNIERILLIGSLILVLILEIINSAIEVVVDRIGEEWNLLSGAAKDIASSSVLVTILLALFVWLEILLG